MPVLLKQDSKVSNALSSMGMGFAGRWMIGLAFAGSLSSCVSLSDRWETRGLDRAFVRYWADRGPASEGGLRLAVKDNIDMQGVVTTAGSSYLARYGAPAARDAACLALARRRGVNIVGKTNLTEFAVTVSGENRHFGMPRNRWDGRHDYIPGGSSSGSAVAVARGYADVAFGTDTAGSIRVPAACCGIFGLKTTFGLVPIEGVFPISPKHLDTVGPMARTVDDLVRGMDLLQEGFAGKYRAAMARKPSARQYTVGRLYLNGTHGEIDRVIDEALRARGFRVVKLDGGFREAWKQAERDGKTVAMADAWVSDRGYAGKKGVTATTKLVLAQGEMEHKTGYEKAVRRKAAWQRELRDVFRTVDFIAVPTLQTLPPRAPFWNTSVAFEWQVFHSQNTVGVNYAGNPALAVPLALPQTGGKVAFTSLQLVGRPLSEADLLNAGRLLESKP